MKKKTKKPKAKKKKYKKLTKKVKEDVRALAKKKFIILKIKEIGITIGSILGIIFLPYLVGLWFFKNSKTTLEDFCRNRKFRGLWKFRNLGVWITNNNRHIN